MGFFRNVLDGVLSFCAFLLTLVVFAAPAWATYLAVTAGLVTAWIYVPAVGMLYVGANLAIAFLRKALDGVSPLRTRKRS
ncbi:hypothetical protein [Sulfitobacter donghicola]|uniref:Uncharacterized protein n=1 Tax=Sulfitobacter donghicola DSW-25 = KCTC 12864 = JCM 14565 TaxID=1300350 RepID=A0A073II13_9RHOB|nr:hypothetical protein [Sulfitobacter donghicola]KEJ89424.1 hypothetical protein DSW25_10480 [Sulfitobacter donghicola DSW-25 = KCTC 12864 = JCM 14565]KIN69244.1 hypothetical protein Z948_2983 [Sulfitobacter donghicola DSW-25 = KCTC 12864 = JCM 14565]